MRKIILLILMLAIFGVGNALADEFTLKSSDIGEKISINQVYSGYGCTGKNISPALNWSNVPKNTRGFAVTLFDPDAPTGKGWWHWIIFNIPANVNALKAGAGDLQKNLAPEDSIQSQTDFGKAGYGGPCPPKGDKPHRYIFTVYALDRARLNLDKNALPAGVGFVLYQHTKAKASFISHYGR